MVYEFEKERVERALQDYIHLFNKKFLKEIHSYEDEEYSYYDDNIDDVFFEKL